MTEPTLQLVQPASGAPPAAAPPPGQAQIANLGLALQTLLTLQAAQEGSPRMGLFYGDSGYGKTVGCAFAAARTGAAYVEARSIWTQRSLLEGIAEELGVSVLARSAPRILDQVIDALNREPKPLLIDEMDHLVTRRHVEIIRDIHDHTRSPIMMIGEEGLPAKLKGWERFDNRILVMTRAVPASGDDAVKLARHYCSRVEVAEDLARHFADRCRGVTRRIVVNLQEAQLLAIGAGEARIDRAWWADRPVRNGDLPARRKAA